MEKSMGMKIFGILAYAVAGILQAQTLDLRGRVVQANGTPVPDATVELKVRGTSTKTAADGSFAFTGNVALNPMGGAPLEYRLESGFLSIELPAPLELHLEVVDAAGRSQGGLVRRLSEGQHRIALAEALPSTGVEAGLYFLRMRMGGETITHPFFHSGNGSAGTVFAPAFPDHGMALAKQAAAVDTLRVRKTGFQDLNKDIASYTAGNLGDLSLSPATTDGWVNLFNGKDLTGWVPLIHLGGGVGVNKDSTFRPDPENNGIRVSYDKYTGSFGGDKCKCGNLYYNKLLTNYRIRVTYRFFDPQASTPPSWGKNNSGLMIFGIDPTQVTGDPVFPPIIEIQLLGNPSGGGSTTVNYCEMTQFVTPTVLMTHTGSCGNNRDAKAAGSGKPLNPASTWTTVEADVHVTGDTKVYIWPDTVNPALIMSKPMYNGKAVTGGYLALQSESQPIVFKDIMLKELP
jgi:3-keto-disaccharide hydrolase